MQLAWSFVTTRSGELTQGSTKITFALPRGHPKDMSQLPLGPTSYTVHTASQNRNTQDSHIHTQAHGKGGVPKSRSRSSHKRMDSI